jgi:hypothetical protein
MLLATVALWLFFQAMATNRWRDWLLYALACTAGLYTHYYFALLPLVAGGLLLLERRTWDECKRGVLAHAAFAAACLPAIALLRDDLAYQAAYTIDAPFNIVTLGYAYFSVIAGYSVGPSLRELHSLPALTAARLMLPWVLAAGGSVLVLGYAALKTVGWRPAIIRLIVLVTVPVVGGGALAVLMGVGFRVRYFAWIAIPLLVLIGAGLASPRLRAIRLPAAFAARGMECVHRQPRARRAILERGCPRVRRIHAIHVHAFGAGVRHGEIHDGPGSALLGSRLDRVCFAKCGRGRCRHGWDTSCRVHDHAAPFGVLARLLPPVPQRSGWPVTARLGSRGAHPTATRFRRDHPVRGDCEPTRTHAAAAGLSRSRGVRRFAARPSSTISRQIRRQRHLAHRAEPSSTVTVTGPPGIC